MCSMCSYINIFIYEYKYTCIKIHNIIYISVIVVTMAETSHLIFFKQFQKQTKKNIYRL